MILTVKAAMEVSIPGRRGLSYDIVRLQDLSSSIMFQKQTLIKSKARHKNIVLKEREYCVGTVFIHGGWQLLREREARI